MSRVSLEDLSLAITWLDLNEGPDGESDACKRVAEFLRKEQARRAEAAAVAEVVRQTGVTRQQARGALKHVRSKAI